MKDLKEILGQFKDVQQNPISEELLGAYIEGKLSGPEADSVEQQIASNRHLGELFHDVYDSGPDKGESPLDRDEDDQGMWEPGMPPTLFTFANGDEFSYSDGEVEEIGETDTDGDRFHDEKSLYKQSAENSFGDNDLNSKAMSINGKHIIYGEAGENISDPVYILQPDDHSCALRSQQIVLRDFGIDIPFKDLEQIALDNGVYTNEGTYAYDIGKVLQLAGVGMHQTVGNSVDDLINELIQGHRVIVSVDANELWYNSTRSERLLNWFKDTVGPQGGNHALIVAGVEVDPVHPENSKVVLTDTGAGQLRIEYPMEQFKEAWGDSNCFMAATDAPAPYQYDAENGMEVPSNFVVQQYINDFVANNSYQLSPDMINVPQGYQPAFTGHLDVVGKMDYDTFKSDYDEMVSNRLPSFLTVKEQIDDLAKPVESQESAYADYHAPEKPFFQGHSEEGPSDQSESIKQSISSVNEEHEDDVPEAHSFFTDDPDHEDSDESSLLTEDEGEIKVGGGNHDSFANDDESVDDEE